jgi:hypothetical protein
LAPLSGKAKSAETADRRPRSLGSGCDWAFPPQLIPSSTALQAAELRHNTLPIGRKNVAQRFAQARYGCL